jgi:ferrous iron transport protein B
MGAWVIVALNMMDEADSRNHRIDVAGLSHLLGTPVVPMVANRNRGTTELFDEIVKVAENKARVKGLKVEYGREVEQEISKLEKLISQSELSSKYSPRWLAVKLLERDEEIIKKFREVEHR